MNPEQVSPHPVCLLISLAVALLVLGISRKSSWRRSGRWAALLLLGQSLALHLVAAGPQIHFQHYRLPDLLAAPLDRLATAALVLISIAVATGLRSRGRRIPQQLGVKPGAVRAILVAGIVVAAGVFPSREPARYLVELVLYAWLAGLQLGCLLLLVLDAPPDLVRRWSDRVVGLFRNRPGNGWRMDAVPLLCAAWVLAVSATLSTYSYERHPHIPDEVAYVYQANYLSEGRLYAPPAPVPEAASVILVDCDEERCLSPFPPGWPAVLAVGALFDSHWLVNPLLAALNIFLVFGLLRMLYGAGTARLAVMLLAASPWYLLMAMSFMSHMFALTAALLAVLPVARVARGGHPLWGVPAGLAIGLLTLTRPLEGVMLATTLGLASLFLRGTRFRFAPALLLALGIAAGLLPTLAYNERISGDPLEFPVMAYMEQTHGAGTNRLGFGEQRGVSWNGLDPFPGHGMADASVNAVLNVVAVNVELFGWGTGSLLFLLLLLLFRREHELSGTDWWLVLPVAIMFVLQSLYWFSGAAGFGARYYFLAIVPLVTLTARAVQLLSARPTNGVRDDESGGSDRAGPVYLALFILSLGALVNFLPWRAIDKFYHYRDMRPDVGRMIAEQNLGRVLLLVRGRQHPDVNSALAYTAIDPDGGRPVVAWDKSPEIRRRVLAAFPDRDVYLLNGPSLTGGAYRIVAGPLAADSTLLQGELVEDR